MALPGIDEIRLHRLDIPITFHHPYDRFGFNPCNKTLSESNKKMLDSSLNLCDEFSSDVLVVHPGTLNGKYVDSKNSSVESAYDFFLKNFDKRIHFENICPPFSPFCTVSALRELFSKTKIKNFCFDIEHAFVTWKILGMRGIGSDGLESNSLETNGLESNSLESDVEIHTNVYDFINSYFEFEPRYFHFCAINSNFKKEDVFKFGKSHMNFSKNNFDWQKIMKNIAFNSRITLETNHLDSLRNLNTQEQIKDLEFVKRLFN